MKKVTYPAGPDSYPLSNHMGTLLDIGEKAAEKITEVTKKEHIILLGTGTSGAFMMTAVANGLVKLGRVPHGVLLVKDSEKSTHRGVDGIPNQSIPTAPAVFIVDDQIASGATLTKIVERLSKIYYRGKTGMVRIPSIVTGIVLAREASQEVVEEIVHPRKITYLIVARLS